MNDNQATQLLQKLLESTRSGRLRWDISEGTAEGMLTTSIGGNKIELTIHISVTIRIKDQNGEVIEETTPMRATQAIAQELYQAAWQTASGTDRIINDIIRELSVA